MPQTMSLLHVLGLRSSLDRRPTRKSWIWQLITLLTGSKLWLNRALPAPLFNSFGEMFLGLSPSWAGVKLVPELMIPWHPRPGAS